MRISTCSVGDPAWQSEWELQAALLTIDTWLPRLRGQPLCLLQSDSTATLHAVMHASGKTPALSALAARSLHDLSVPTSSQYQKLRLRCAQSAERRRTAASDLGQARRDVPKPRQPGFFWGWHATLLISRQRQSLAQQRAQGLSMAGSKERAKETKRSNQELTRYQ